MSTDQEMIRYLEDYIEQLTAQKTLTKQEIQRLQELLGDIDSKVAAALTHLKILKGPQKQQDFTEGNKTDLRDGYYRFPTGVNPQVPIFLLGLSELDNSPATLVEAVEIILGERAKKKIGGKRVIDDVLDVKTSFYVRALVKTFKALQLYKKHKDHIADGHYIDPRLKGLEQAIKISMEELEARLKKINIIIP